MRILYAEDEVALSKAVAKILERNHYTVDVVSNGLDALDYLQNGNYDIAILDILMPPAVEPAIAPNSIRITSTVLAAVGQRLKSVVENPVVVIIVAT